MNEFLWETTTSDAFLVWLFERYDTDIIVATHTGLHWRVQQNSNSRGQLQSSSGKSVFIQLVSVQCVMPPVPGESIIASSGIPLPSTPRKYQGIIAMTPISQKAASRASDANIPAAFATMVNASGAMKAPMRPTATDKPMPVERK
jgi:hypothetical protein